MDDNALLIAEIPSECLEGHLIMTRDLTNKGEMKEKAAAYHTMSEQIMKEKAIALMEDYPCEIKEIVYTEQDTGISKLELEVEVAPENIVSMLSFSALDSKIQVEFVDSGLSQFIVNMKDEAGECFLYVAVDFVANECNAWVSPEVQDDFVRLEGPIRAE